jgi:hypothetical protein
MLSQKLCDNGNKPKHIARQVRHPAVFTPHTARTAPRGAAAPTTAPHPHAELPPLGRFLRTPHYPHRTRRRARVHSFGPVLAVFRNSMSVLGFLRSVRVQFGVNASNWMIFIETMQTVGVMRGSVSGTVRILLDRKNEARKLFPVLRITRHCVNCTCFC